MKEIKILLAAGGTGGHLFPAVAVLNELQVMLAERYSLKIISIGNPEKIEYRFAQKRGWTFHPIPMRGFFGFGFKTIGFLWKTIKSVSICRQIIESNGIDFVLATGAFISYPAGIAASMSKVPLFVIEPNIFPGRANRLLSKRADLMFLAYEDTREWFKTLEPRKIRVFGCPVRSDLFVDIDKERAKSLLGFDPNKFLLLVFGGSLGAKSINEAIYENIPFFESQQIQLYWQVGKNFEKQIPKKPNIKVVEFIEDMGLAYRASDLVISRAGASTIAEICTLGKPAILVPYPKATNNHQEINARQLEKRNAALVIGDDELQKKLIPEITRLLNDSCSLEEISKNVIRFSQADSSKKIAQEIINFLKIELI